MGLKKKELGYPLEFWEYFEKISKIPRCSGKEGKIREFIENEAKDFNYTTKSDNVGNLLVEIPPITKKNKRKRVCLQSHMDMVCEKNGSNEHNFSKDPLKLKIITINEEKWLTAEGTTLGADNGVGIAYSLAIMKKYFNKEIRIDNIDLSFLFTVDEESGLLGAFNIDTTLLKCDYLINLDSESDDSFTIGCAGGINTFGLSEFESENVDKYIKESIPYKLSITGLIGGHSGVDIHKGRVNAIKLMSNILNESDLSLISLHLLNGGNRTNAIPREAQAIFFLEKEQEKGFINSLEQIILKNKRDLKQIEPNLQITIFKLKNFREKLIIPDIIKNKLVSLIQAIPDGPITMHSKISNLVHTSTNFASINAGENTLDIKTSQRSLEEISKYKLRDSIKTELESAGLGFQINNEGDYPGWSPDFDSKFLLKSKVKYKELFNKEVMVKVAHAGLECGILKAHFPDVEMISFGPTIKGAHSPDEVLRIASVEKIWDFLIQLIQEI